MKKVALILTLAMILIAIVAATAFADTGSITINQPSSDSVSNAGQTFNAYKVFDVTYSGTAYSYTVATKFSDFFSAAPFTGKTDSEIAAIIAGYDADAMSAFAKDLMDYVDTNSIAADGMGTGLPRSTPPADATTITGLDLGYYLVTGKVVADGPVTVVTACSLTTTNPTASITPKADAPTIDKEVSNHNFPAPGWKNWTDINIGDTADFRLTSKVPDMIGYESYTYTVHDIMSAGLTFGAADAANVKVYIDDMDTPIAAASHYTLNTSPTDGHTFDIVFDPTYFVGLTAGTDILITYSATLNASAVIGTGSPANTNKVHLTYSNNPYTDDTGTTPDITVTVYTFEMDIFKYTDSPAANTPLAGAKFTLCTDAAGTQPIEFIQTAAGTSILPLKLRRALTAETGTITEFLSPASGNINLLGLDAGTYYLVETAPPDGYNSVDPIEVEIALSNNTSGAFTVSVIAPLTRVVTPTAIVYVKNSTGAELPTTGGVGRTIFLITGLTLMVLAGGALILRKKLASNK